MAANASEEQKQIIALAEYLGVNILATGGAATGVQVTDSSVDTLFTRLGTEYEYTVVNSGD